jgi:hypothetical protein
MVYCLGAYPLMKGRVRIPMCNILFSSLNLTPFILFVCLAHSILFNLFQVLMIQTAQTRILIDISDSEDDHQEWDEKYWIGVGKKFPVSGEVPAFIEVARSKALALPPVYSLYIPSPKMSITDLLKTKLPVQSSALIMHSAAGAFSKEKPNEDMTRLKTRSIPPKAWLEQLEKDFGQAWFNGTQSIEDKRYKNSREVFSNRT